MRPLPVKKVVSRGVLLVSIAASLYFVPWPLVLAKFTPLPSSLQALVDQYPSYGFEGAIIYIQKKAGNFTLLATTKEPKRRQPDLRPFLK